MKTNVFNNLGHKAYLPSKIDASREKQPTGRIVIEFLRLETVYRA